MPLIKHSPEFIAKREAKLREKKEIEENNKREARAKEYVDYNELIREMNSIVNSNRFSFEPELSTIDRARFQDNLEILLRNKIYFQHYFTLDECKALFLLMRKVRLNKELCKEVFGADARDPEVFVKTENLIHKIKFNLFHMQEVDDLGLNAYIMKYKKKVKSKQDRIVQKAKNQNSESNETREHREKRIQEYIRSLNFNEGNSNESL